MYQKLSFMVVSLLALSSFVSQQTSGQITFIDPLQPTPAQLADPLTIGPGELVAVDPSGAPFGILMAEGNSVVNLTGDLLVTKIRCSSPSFQVIQASTPTADQALHHLCLWITHSPTFRAGRFWNKHLG